MHVVSSESQHLAIPGRTVARAQSRPLAAREPDKRKSAPLDPKVADRLLDLLSTDDAFRRLFKKDPEAALVTAGWEPQLNSNMASPAWCMGVDRLATKQAISKSREELRTMLTVGLPLQPVQLNLGPMVRGRSRK